MDSACFDDLLRALTAARSRRRMLAVVALGLGSTARVPRAASASKRRKKPSLNAFGCVNVGKRCKRASHCCSGICKGKKGRKRCKAHDSDICRAGQRNPFCGGQDVLCTTSTGHQNAVCQSTTGNAGYCVFDFDCTNCQQDADCRAQFGERAACVVCSGCAEGTACVGPGDPIP